MKIVQPVYLRDVLNVTKRFDNILIDFKSISEHICSPLSIEQE